MISIFLPAKNYLFQENYYSQENFQYYDIDIEYHSSYGLEEFIIMKGLLLDCIYIRNLNTRKYTHNIFLVVFIKI